MNKEKKAAPCSSFPEFMLLLRPADFFDTLRGCLKDCRGKECASVGSDKAIRAASFLKRNISPFGLSHPLPYARMAAFFDFPNEKIFSFPVEDFR